MLDSELLLSSPLTMQRAGYHVHVNRIICEGHGKASQECNDDHVKHLVTIWSGTEKIFYIYSKRRNMGVLAFTNNNESIMCISLEVSMVTKTT